MLDIDIDIERYRYIDIDIDKDIDIELPVSGSKAGGAILPTRDLGAIILVEFHV